MTITTTNDRTNLREGRPITGEACFRANSYEIRVTLAGKRKTIRLPALGRTESAEAAACAQRYRDAIAALAREGRSLPRPTLEALAKSLAGMPLARLDAAEEASSILLNAGRPANELAAILSGIVAAPSDNAARAAVELANLAATGQAALPDGERSIVDWIPPGLSPERAAAIAPNPGTLPCSFGHVAELWLSGKLATAFPGRVRPKQNYDSTRSALSHVLPILSRLPCRAFTLDQGEAALSSIPTRLGPAYTRTIARTVRQLLGFAVYPLRWIETNPLPSQWVPRSEVSLERQILMPSEEHAIIACTSIPLYLRVFVAWQARQGTRYIDAARMTLASITFQHDKAIVTLAQTKDNDPRSWALSADDTAMIRAWIEWRRAHGERLRQSSPLFISARGMRLVNSNLAMWIRTAAWEAGIRRAALFSRSAHSWPHEEHDLRALFCTYALAKCRPLSWITDRTGHSLHSLGAYQRPARRWAEAELGDLAPSNRAIPEIAAICGLDPLPSPTLTTQPGDMTVRPTTIFPPRRLVSAQVLAQSGTPCGRREKLISASNQVVLTMPLAAAKRSPVGTISKRFRQDWGGGARHWMVFAAGSAGGQ